MNWWWTVHERLFMWTFQELLMNCSWTIFFHNKFLSSSWTVMVNCSRTLVHEPTMRVFYELFMNCSWMFMNVHEQFIKSWTTFRRGLANIWYLLVCISGGSGGGGCKGGGVIFTAVEIKLRTQLKLVLNQLKISWDQSWSLFSTSWKQVEIRVEILASWKLPNLHGKFLN